MTESVEIQYFDANDNEVPAALAEQYASKVVRRVYEGRSLVKHEIFYSKEKKPILPYMEPDIKDEDENDGSMGAGPGA